MNQSFLRRALIGVLALVLATLTATASLAHGDEPTTTPEPSAPLAPSDSVPTYYGEIQALLNANCVSCHLPGEIGYDIFAMDSDDAIIAGAEDIALVVSTGYMPPWPPSDLSPHFLFDRSLSDADILRIVTWGEQGAPAGTPPDATPETALPVAPSGPVIERDLVLTMPEPYTPNQDAADDYRCFILDPGFTEDTFIVGYDIVPDNTGAVHHTVLFPGSPAARSEAEALSGADGKPGWECYGGSGLTAGAPDRGMLRPLLPVFRAAGGIGRMRQILQADDAVAQLDAVIAAADPDGTLAARIQAVGGTANLVGLLRQGLIGPALEGGNQPVTGVIGAWVPGSTAAQFPVDTGLLIPAGGFIVMQMHYNTLANDAPDQSALVLDTASGETLRAARVLDINGPVEIPCPVGVTGDSCSREQAIAQSGDGSDALLAICGQSLDEYADQDAANAVTSCDYLVPTGGWALSILSHMHTIGVSTQTMLNPDTPDEQILIDIPDWDFNWQGNYWFADPIWLDEGDTVRIICTYDNSVTRANPTPRYIVAGEGTADEMCLNFVTMLPADPGTPAPHMANWDGAE